MEQLGVFAKYWEAGNAKTRLAASIGDQPAADLYRLFIETVLHRVENEVWCKESTCKRVLAYTPPERVASFRELVTGTWSLQPQTDGDLGTRMSHYFAQAFAAGCQKVVLIGSDSPDLPRGTFGQAFRALDTSDAVIGPSDDGGYYLIGMRKFIPQLFDGIVWSTDVVFRQTVARLSSENIPWHALPAWYDVDTIDDLRRLRSSLHNATPTDSFTERLRTQIDDALRNAS